MKSSEAAFRVQPGTLMHRPLLCKFLIKPLQACIQRPTVSLAQATSCHDGLEFSNSSCDPSHGDSILQYTLFASTTTSAHEPTSDSATSETRRASGPLLWDLHGRQCPLRYLLGLLGSAHEIAAQLRPVLVFSLLAPFRKASTPNARKLAFLLEHTMFRVLDAVILAAPLVLLRIGQLRCCRTPSPSCYCCSHALTWGKGSVAQGHPDPHHPRRPRIGQTSVCGLCCCWKLQPAWSGPSALSVT